MTKRGIKGYWALSERLGKVKAHIKNDFSTAVDQARQEREAEEAAQLEAMQKAVGDAQ